MCSMILTKNTVMHYEQRGKTETNQQSRANEQKNQQWTSKQKLKATEFQTFDDQKTVF